MKLDGKVIFITGASRGIGAVSARMLAKKGARVILGARSSSELKEQAATIRAEGGDATSVALDVTSDESVKRAVAEALESHGHVDVLINNAGNGGLLSFFVDSSPSLQRETFDVHVFGTERMTRALLPSMLARGSGRIMNVVSTVGYVPMPGAAAYSSAKAAIIAFTQSLRGELADTPIELVLFSPPHTQTEAGARWELPLPKKFSPDDAARALTSTLERDRMDVLAGGNGSLLWLQRLWPSAADRIMRGIGLEATARERARSLPSS